MNRPDLILQHVTNLELLDKADELGNTPLHYAVDTGFTHGVDLLTNHGCQMELFNIDHLSPLMLALKKHHIGIAEMLIDRGASPYSLNLKVESALNMAIEMLQINLIDIMLEQDAVPHMKMPALYSACSKVAQWNLIEYIDLLLNAGANLNIPFNHVDPPLNISCSRGNLEMVEMWLEHGAPIERYDSGGLTPLMRASSRGHFEICQVLINRGALVKAVSSDGQNTALSLALQGNHLNCVNLLTASSENEVGQRRGYGSTPLIEATILNRLDLMFEHTLNVGILNQPDVFGNTPLHHAVESGFMQGVIQLVNQGCQLELFNSSHFTPLMLALKRHHIAIAEFLIHQGASPYSLNPKYESALNMAIEMRQYGLVKVMLTRVDLPVVKVASLYVACATVAKCDGGEFIAPLMEAGASLHFTLRDIDPPLNISASRGNPRMVKEWLRYGAAVDSYNLEGLTPLMSASQFGYLDVCKILVEHGARIDAVSADGKSTPISLALETRQFQCAAFLTSVVFSCPN
ncbi:unnamed protein product [Rodentolepis nana]|uniref:ANK_REP_REGION domain-containing protein n=1 Tax=Rodentolepis nana TaxID=102285 RepID=A0A0R3TB82_RODNA|nr:unnamed protein product [Rodentolepis nana]